MVTHPGTRLAVALLATLTLAACDEATAPRSYALEVMNRHPHTMVISVEDGATTQELGPVAAASRRTFEIHDPRQEMVTVVAVNEAGTHTVRKQVMLREDQAVMVEITMDGHGMGGHGHGG